MASSQIDLKCVLAKLEKEICDQEDLLAVVAMEIQETCGLERTELRQELGQRRKRLSSLRAQKGQLMMRLGLLKRDQVLLNDQQRLEDLAERMVAALFGVSLKQLRRWIEKLENEQHLEQQRLSEERYLESCAEYVCKLTDRIAIWGTLR